MSGRFVSMLQRATLRSQSTGTVLAQTAVRTFAGVAPAAPSEGKLPPSLERIGVTQGFPNEYPGQNYAFNWCLNGDGVTPIHKSAFRITKPLDLKVAGLEVPKKNPLQVKAAAATEMPEAGASDLTFAKFDEASQRVRDLLSMSSSLFCPEGHVPGTRRAVRVITNSATLAPQLLAYLDRAPRMEPPESLPITVYALEDADEEFAGYAIEEVEVPIKTNYESPGWSTLGSVDPPPTEPKSVAAVVVSSKKPDLKVIVAGIELSQEALAADEVERESKKESSAE